MDKIFIEVYEMEGVVFYTKVQIRLIEARDNGDISDTHYAVARLCMKLFKAFPENTLYLLSFWDFVQTHCVFIIGDVEHVRDCLLWLVSEGFLREFDKNGFELNTHFEDEYVVQVVGND